MGETGEREIACGAPGVGSVPAEPALGVKGFGVRAPECGGLVGGERGDGDVGPLWDFDTGDDSVGGGSTIHKGECRVQP